MAFRFGDGRDWFFEKRFGLFIHWGIYSIDGWHEQMQYRNSLPKADYRPLMNRFDPAKFDPEEWLDFAEAHGMRYLCFTTKHIDGFCMWDTKQTDFKITNTPYAKDTLEMLANACARRGLPLCLYYSTIDNDHPAYPHRGGSYEKPRPEPGESADLERYLEFVRAQVEELCTNYGEISGFWWDCLGEERIGVRDESFNDLVRSLQPSAVINNRGFSPGDFDTPERDWHDGSTEGNKAFERPVEACQSIGIESWGYRADEDYYSPRHIEASMARIFARGGNYLLNVGPRSDGTFPPDASRVLDPVGSWLSKARECFDDAEYATPLFHADNILVDRDFEATRRGRTVYVLFTSPSAGDRMLLKPIRRAPVRAVLLNTGEPVSWSIDRIPSQWRDNDSYLRLVRLDFDALCSTVPVVRLEFDEDPL